MPIRNLTFVFAFSAVSLVLPAQASQTFKGDEWTVQIPQGCTSEKTDRGVVFSLPGLEGALQVSVMSKDPKTVSDAQAHAVLRRMMGAGAGLQSVAFPRLRGTLAATVRENGSAHGWFLRTTRRIVFVTWISDQKNPDPVPGAVQKLLRSWKGTKDERRPPAARFQGLTDRQNLRFCRLVEARLRKKKRAAYLWEDGSVRLEKSAVINLHNCAETCRALPAKDWAQTVANFMDNAEAAMTTTARGSSFGEAKGRLLLRLVPKSYGNGKIELVRREDLAGLLTAVVIDHSTHVEFLDRKKAEEWGKSDKDLFAIAMENLRKRERSEWVKINFPNGKTLHAVIAPDDLFAASELLLLAHLPDKAGKYGALVQAPGRHVVSVMPIDSRSDFDLAGQLLGRMPTPGKIAHPLSSKTYWWDKKAFHVVEKDGAGGFVAPKPLRVLLDQKK